MNISEKKYAVEKKRDASNQSFMSSNNFYFKKISSPTGSNTNIIQILFDIDKGDEEIIKPHVIEYKPLININIGDEKTVVEKITVNLIEEDLYYLAKDLLLVIDDAVSKCYIEKDEKSKFEAPIYNRFISGVNVSKIEGRFVKIVKDINPKNDLCESSSSSSSLYYSPGVIAGIVIGSLVLVALIVALIIFLIRKLSVSNTDYKIEMTKI
jgi:hypothetical protein